MQGGRQPSKEGGSSSIGSASAPSGEEEKDGSMPPDNAAPPEGEANKGGPGNRSDSSAPNGNTDGEPQEMINLTGEEKTIEISDESIITTRSGQESAAASLSQIEVGSILKVAVKSAEGGTETLVSVEIMSASPDDANKPDEPSV
ncbi:hypothetical protein SDC9_149354 [bioreactor metagenome]|uniref:DUF5666 domain-containing protein n=1 Tax=bioreactor metagenome TaxID=1076179 RepID=A0A645EJI9_9ZZZZ